MKIIHYEVMQEVNVGTREEPKIEKYLQAVSLGPMSNETFESNYAIAVAEACGEVTVEDDGEPEHEPEPSTEEVLLEIAADHEARLCNIELGV